MDPYLTSKYDLDYVLSLLIDFPETSSTNKFPWNTNG